MPKELVLNGMKLRLVSVEDLAGDPYQPRKTFERDTLKGMAKSMEKHGLMIPIEIDENNQIIIGERRWRASKMAGLGKVPCIVKEGLLDVDKLERQIIEDVHHEDIPVMEKAHAWSRLRKFHGTAEAAKILGVTPEHFGRVISMIKLSDETKEAVDNGTITGRTARVLTAIKDPNLERKIVKKIKRENLSPKEVEKIVPVIKRAPEPIKKELLKSRSHVDADMAKKIMELGEEGTVVEVFEEVMEKKMPMEDVDALVKQRAAMLAAVDSRTKTQEGARFISELERNIDTLSKLLVPGKAKDFNARQRDRITKMLRNFAENRLLPFLKDHTGEDQFVSMK